MLRRWPIHALVLGGLVAVGTCAAAGADTSGKQGEGKASETVAVEDVEDVEVVDEVEVVDASDAEAATPPTFTVSQIVGRNHPAAVHLPIGFLVATLLLELLSVFRPSLDLGRSGIVITVATALSFVPAALSGFVRAGELFQERPAPELLLEHRNAMIAMALVFLAAMVLRIVKKDKLTGKVQYVHLALLAVAVLLAAAGGHHGGQLVYGENFLPY